MSARWFTVDGQAQDGHYLYRTVFGVDVRVEFAEGVNPDDKPMDVLLALVDQYLASEMQGKNKQAIRDLHRAQGYGARAVVRGNSLQMHFPGAA